MHKFLEKLKKELKELEDKPSLSMGEWQRIQILTEIKKNILKIKMLEEGGSHSYDADESYERGYSERRMRDARGRYRNSYDGSYEGDDSYEGRSYRGGSYDGGSYRGDYDRGSSGHIEGKHEMIRDLRGMLDRCENQKDKEQIHRWIKQLENED